jgi:hypothetical protein
MKTVISWFVNTQMFPQYKTQLQSDSRCAWPLGVSLPFALSAWKWECFVKPGWRNDANEEKFEGHTCSGRRFVYSQLSIAAGSVSADPHAGHDMSAMQMPADENFTEMTSMEPIVTESRTPIPPVTDADGRLHSRNLQVACDSRQCD